MKSPKVLVTGGAGYIGSQTVLSLLAADFEAVVIDDLSTGSIVAVPPESTFVQGRVGDVGLMAKILLGHQIQDVIHFAGSLVVAESVADPLSYYENNVGQTIGLLRACDLAGIKRFVFSSTAAVYGDSCEVAVAETLEPKPLSPYGRSKLAIEGLLADYARSKPSFRYAVLRYFNVAGADIQRRTGSRAERSSHLIAAALDTAAGGRPHLEIFGKDYPTPDGTCERDYVHVSDLAHAHICALKYLQAGGESQVLNCGNGRGYSVLEVVQAVERCIGRELPKKFTGRRPGDPARIVADASKISSLLNWTPRYADLDVMVSTAHAWQTSLSGAKPRAAE